MRHLNVLSNVEIVFDGQSTDIGIRLKIAEMKINDVMCTVRTEFSEEEKIPQVANYDEYYVDRIGKLPNLTFGNLTENACLAVAAIVEPEAIQILCDKIFQGAIFNFLANNPKIEQNGNTVIMKRQ